jgi:Na+/melibiose symporter-like transporter
MGAVPWCFMVIFIFFCPKITQIGQIGVFYWFMIFLCINDGFFSLYDINRVALFPDKFRDNKDRKIAGTITAFLETFGILGGVLIPVLVLSMLGNEIGWGVQAIVVSIVSVICVLLMIPGVREGPEMRQRRTKLDEKEKESFFAGMKFTLKDRNFMAYTSLYTFYTSCMGLVMASIPFFVQDILQLPTIGEMVLVFYVIAVLCTAPLWYMFSFKLGIKRVALIGAMILAFMGIPFFFVPVGPEGLGLTIIILIAAGCVDGAIISMTMPLFSSVVDKATVSSGRRREGMYQGTSTFFSRVGIAIQAIVFWIVRTFTGYHSGSTSTSELMGLRIQMSIFPMIIIGTGIIIFSLLYKIPSEELEANTKKLKELGL